VWKNKRTVFPHVLAKRLLAFRTVSTGSTAISQQTTKPDTSLATRTGHFHLLPTSHCWRVASATEVLPQKLFQKLVFQTTKCPDFHISSSGFPQLIFSGK
jgi:hypothetical protein